MAGEVSPRGFEPEEQGKDELRETIESQYAWRNYERSPYRELLERGGPEAVRHAVRMICAKIEQDVLFDGEPPNSYSMRIQVQELEERASSVEFTYPLNFQPMKTREEQEREEKKGPRSAWPKALVDEDYDTDPVRRERLVRVLRESREEIIARNNLAEKFLEQMAFSADVDIYARDYFLRYGKKFLPSWTYAVIFNSKETHEGFVPFGEKVEKAFEAFMKIGEGEAEIGGKKMPNVFGIPAHRGLMLNAINNYVLPELKRKRGNRGSTSNTGLERFEDFDDRVATMVGLELFRHFDYDVYYCFSTEGTSHTFKNRFELTDDEKKDLNLETGVGTGDSAKMMYIEARRWSEWGRGETEKHRKFPRVAGNPMSFGCYPMLTLPMLELVSTDLSVDEEIKKQIAAKMNGKTYEMPDKIPISVHDRCFGKKIEIRVKSKREVVVRDKKTGKEMKDPKTGKPKVKFDDVQIRNPDGSTSIEETLIKINYEHQPCSLGDVLWDNARVVENKRVEKTGLVDGKLEETVLEIKDGEWLNFAMGPRTEAFEVPYKLQIFYAHAGMYFQFMRTDYAKQFAEVTEGDLLLKMNKGIDIALVMMGGARGINPKTIEKLSIYIRCVFLGALAASVEPAPPEEKSLEHGPLINTWVGYRKGDDTERLILMAARICNFLPKEGEGEDTGGWYSLVKEIRKKRKAPLPGDCVVNGKKFFTDKELNEISCLYPLGLRG